MSRVSVAAAMPGDAVALLVRVFSAGIEQAAVTRGPQPVQLTLASVDSQW